MEHLGRAIGKYLLELSVLDESIWVLDGDLADSNGADVFVQKNDRFVQAGIAEQNMVSMAAGLATTCKKPWVFSFSAFLCYRAYDQIRTCVSQTRLPVTLVGSHAGACTGRNGKTHASLNDIALMSTLPFMQIWAPADADDVKHIVRSQLLSNSPSYVRCPRDSQPKLPGISSDIRQIGTSTPVAIFCYGISAHWAVHIQEELHKQHIEVTILHFCKVWPLDPSELESKLKGIEVAFVLEDHYPIGGLYSLMKYFKTPCSLISFSWPLNWHSHSGLTHELLAHYGLDTITLSKKIINELEKMNLLKLVTC